MPEPETCIKKGQSDKTVHWKDNESADKKTDKRKQSQKDQIIIKPIAFSGEPERKTKKLSRLIKSLKMTVLKIKQ